MPTTELWTNNGRSTLASGVTNSAVTIPVGVGEGARFPNPSAGQFFWVTVVDGLGNYEIMKCTARSGDSLTVVRAQQGSAARSFNAGDTVSLRATKNTFEGMVQKDSDTTISGSLTVPAPTSSGHAARKADVDTRVPLAGGNMTGTLNITSSVGYGLFAISNGADGVRGETNIVSGSGVIGLSENGSVSGRLGYNNTHGLYSNGLIYAQSSLDHVINGRSTNVNHGGVIGWSNNGVIYGMLGYADIYSFYGIGKILTVGHIEASGGNVTALDAVLSGSSVNTRLAALEAAVAALQAIAHSHSGPGDGD